MSELYMETVSGMIQKHIQARHMKVVYGDSIADSILSACTRHTEVQVSHERNYGLGLNKWTHIQGEVKVRSGQPRVRDTG